MARDPTTLLFSQNTGTYLYNVARKWFPLTSLFTLPVLLFIDAPFGRFTPSSSSPSICLLNGITSWIVMELVSPIAFTYAFLSSPLSYHTPALPSLASPQSLLCALFFVHYANRALINPMRTPSRSKSHIIVPLVGIAFNIVNGSLLGAYLSSPFARIYLDAGYTYTRPEFWIGLALWAVGFVGNIAHDEILLDIRRKAQSKKKAEEHGSTTDAKGTPTPKGEYYGIPQGLLYTYISYPNYLLEWVEWLGFALIAAPFPLPLTFSSDPYTPTLQATLLPLLNWRTWSRLLKEPAYMFAPNFTPPYVFLVAEVLLMLPRAYKGHLWYKQRFGESYPKGRKAVVPFVF